MRPGAELRLVDTGVERLVMPVRFWEKVRFTDTCWIWTGANSGIARPYGVAWNGRRRVKAHRYAYEAANGPIPEGLEVDHLCKVTLCVRPAHLEAVTRRENALRSDSPGAVAVRRNRCKRDHEYTPENTRHKKGGGRECLSCKRMHALAYSARRSAARAELRRAS